MSLYAVKNDEGKWLWVDTFRYPHWPEDISNAQEYGEKADALGDAEDFGGHVVELVEKPEPVEVSEEDGARLEKIRKATCPWDTVSFYAGRNKEYANFLMRAYVNGWKVVKPKRWNVKVPHVDAQEGLWFFVNSDGKVDATYDQDLAAQFTAAEIDQYGLQDCEKVEVRDED